MYIGLSWRISSAFVMGALALAPISAFTQTTPAAKSSPPAQTPDSPASKKAEQSTPAAKQITIQGTVVEKGTQKPLPRVNVFALPSKVKATTDDRGQFEMQVPAGAVEWIINVTDYERLKNTETLSADRPILRRKFYLERQNYLTFETTVYGKNKKRDDTTRILKAEDFANMPGAYNDPIKAVQNLPGVNRASGFSSQVVIQGSDPEDTKYLIDGHQVPIIFHFGGVNSVVIPEAVDRVEFLSAGYGPEYGRANGGLIGVYTKKPQRDRLRGQAYFDLLNSGGAIEGGLGSKGSFFLGARASYVGAALGAVADGNEDFDFTVAPTYYDLTAIYETPITPIDDLKVMMIGSIDTLEFVLNDPVNADPDTRGTFESETSFFRIIPQLTHRHSSRTTSRLSFGIGKDWIKFIVNDNFFRLNNTVLSVRGEVEKELNSYWKAYWGFDNRYQYTRVDLDLPSFFTSGGIANPLSSSETNLASVVDQQSEIGLFWRNELKFSSLTLMPSARMDYFTETGEVLPAPKLAARYGFDNYSYIRTAGGLYYQPPLPQETAEDVGNPNLISPKSYHLTIGGGNDFRRGSSDGFELDSGLFYRFFENLVVTSTDPDIRYTNDGRGTAYGWEMALKYRLSSWTNSLSYTLSRSERWDDLSGRNLAAADQTHNFNWISSVELGSNWKVSTRFRFVTGNPLTPVTGSYYDADNAAYIPIRGSLYSERVTPFLQLDLRVDKKWIFEKWILSAYVDIQNVTNNQNVESVSYSYDYSESQNTTGLPILPTIGLKGEF